MTLVNENIYHANYQHYDILFEIMLIRESVTLSVILWSGNLIEMVARKFLFLFLLNLY